MAELDPDWTLITSFNEWHEGSEVEPSIEDGTKYLLFTADHANKFKARPRAARPGMGPAGPSAAGEKPSMPVALLPGAQSEAALWLLSVGAKVKSVSWSSLVGGLDVKANPVLIYAGGERYTQTVRQSGDVDRALLKYLDEGGALVVAGSEPLPLFYNEKGVVVNALPNLGLPVEGPGAGEPPRGFERPPAGLQLMLKAYTVVVPKLERIVPFPRAADLRWRPVVASKLAAGDRYVPLMTLLDQRGRSWGQGAAIVERKAGGRIAYVWFNLLEEPYGPRLLSALFGLLAKPAAP
jgi:hypothetical protein